MLCTNKIYKCMLYLCIHIIYIHTYIDRWTLTHMILTNFPESEWEKIHTTSNQQWEAFNFSASLPLKGARVPLTNARYVIENMLAVISIPSNTACKCSRKMKIKCKCFKTVLMRFLRFIAGKVLALNSVTGAINMNHGIKQVFLCSSTMNI